MEISGEEIYTSGKLSQEELDIIINKFKEIYPEGYVKIIDVAGMKPFKIQEVVLNERYKEFFFYRNKDAYDSWKKDGRTAANCTDLIHLLSTDEGFSFIYEGEAYKKPLSDLKFKIVYARIDNNFYDWHSSLYDQRPNIPSLSEEEIERIALKYIQVIPADENYDLLVTTDIPNCKLKKRIAEPLHDSVIAAIIPIVREVERLLHERSKNHV